MKAASQHSQTKALVFLVLCVDLLCSGIYLPLLPLLAKDRFSASAATVGAILSAYPAAQFLTAPILGRWSDLYGRKRILILCLCGIAVNYVLLSQASSVYILFISRAFAGALGANVSIAQAYLSDLSKKEDRTSSLSLTGIAFAFGFTIGPVLGGVLSSGGDYQRPTNISLVLSIVNVLIASWLPDSKQFVSSEGSSKDSKLIEGLQSKTIRDCLILRLLFSLSFYLFRNCLPILLASTYMLSAKQSGYVLSYVGLLAGATQGGLMKRLSKKYSDEEIVKKSLGILTFSLLVWSVTQSTTYLLIVLIPICFTIGTITTCSSSYITKIAPATQSGWVLGWCASVDSLAKIVAPLAGGMLIDEFGSVAPGLVAGLLSAVALAVSLQTKSSHNLPPP